MNKLFKLVLICFFAFSLVSCSTAVPLNPETNQPLVENIDQYDHEQKVELQKELINMQEKEKERQQRDELELRKQEYYNYRAERFK